MVINQTIQGILQRSTPKRRRAAENIQEIIRLYNVMMWSTLRLAEKYDCNQAGINVLLRRYGVRIRTRKEAANIPYTKERNIGSKHPHYGKRGSEVPNWKGGKPCANGYTFEFRKSSPSGNKLHRQVYVRDNYECQDCGKSYELGSNKFQAHHVNFDKLDNRLGNLILLCKPCHRIRHKEHKDKIKHRRFKNGN